MILSPASVHSVVSSTSPTDERHSSSRCSLDVFSAETSSLSSRSSTITPSSARPSLFVRRPGGSNKGSLSAGSGKPQHTIHHSKALNELAPPQSLSLSMSPSSSTAGTCSSEAEADAPSSPASSGYGRSTTSEPDDFELPASASHDDRRRLKSLSRLKETPSLDVPPEDRLIPEEDIEFIERLGAGFFSYVDMVRIRSTSEILVRKVAKRDVPSDVNHERAMLLRLKHRNVVVLRGVCMASPERGSLSHELEREMHLLVDFCSGGSLSSLLLDRSRDLSWRTRLTYATDIARGMEYIHCQKIIHRDLTSMNILLQLGNIPRRSHDIGRAVIADFGLSCNFPAPGEKLPTVGTTYFMSPECLREWFYDEKTDVFSFGIILCQLIARIDADPDFGLHRTQHFGLDYIRFNLYCPPDTPMGLLTEAFKCSLMDPAQRPSFNEVHYRLEQLLELFSPQESLPSANSSPLRTGNAQGSSAISSPNRCHLERSRSDAALRRQQRPIGLCGRKLSMYKEPIREGVVVEDIAEIEDSLLLRGEPKRASCRPVLMTPALRSDATPNPFSRHGLSERKIIPPPCNRRASENVVEGSEDDREEQEFEDEENSTDSSGRRSPSRRGRMIRRCSSLPKMEGDDVLSDEDTPSAGCSSAVPGAAAASVSDTGPCSIEDKAFCAIPMVFRDCDDKFLASRGCYKSYRVRPSSSHTSSPTRTAHLLSQSPSPLSDQITECSTATEATVCRPTAVDLDAKALSVLMTPNSPVEKIAQSGEKRESLVRGESPAGSSTLRSSLCMRRTINRDATAAHPAAAKGCTIL